MLQTLQPRHSQNGIGNLEHGTIYKVCYNCIYQTKYVLDHIVSYLNHNKKLNCRPSSEKDRIDREKKMQRKKLKKRMKYQMIANVNGTRFEIGICTIYFYGLIIVIINCL